MYNWKGKKLLILGATKLLGRIVEVAQKNGAYVCVADNLEDSPAKKNANKAFLVDVTDVDLVLDLIKNHNIDGVLTGYSDTLLPVYYQICQKAKLPCYLNLEQIEFTTNKKIFKEVCRRHGIPTIKEYDLKDEINYPVIIKPVDNSGARGISVCYNKEDFERGVKEALRFSKSKKILIEDFVDYEEATIFYIFINNKAYFSIMADRNMQGVGSGFIKLPNGYTFPSKLSTKVFDQLHFKFTSMFEELQVENGVMFVQCFIDKNGMCIPYEPGFRITATMEELVTQHSCGYNSMEMMINFALTGKMVENSINIRKINPFITDQFHNISCLMNTGHIIAIDGVDKILQYSGVISTFQSYNVGYFLDSNQRGKLSQIFLRIIFKGSEDEYKKFLLFINSTLKIVSDKNENLFIKYEW